VNCKAHLTALPQEVARVASGRAPWEIGEISASNGSGWRPPVELEVSSAITISPNTLIAADEGKEMAGAAVLHGRPLKLR
jgi:hypothetical protein